MDYEQKYKHALDLAKQVYDATISEQQKENISIIFPELKENWNEKIRKEILEYFQQFENEELRGVNISDWIAWLEKQGEQKQYDIDVLEKHITKDSISELAHTVIVRNGWEIVDAKEQNPVWSEEDEKELNSCIEAIEACYKWDTMVDWLKSLKERCAWKPSEEQMKALHDMNLTGNISYAGQGQALIELYNDLKKL